jgi:hypothetical protein
MDLNTYALNPLSIMSSYAFDNKKLWLTFDQVFYNVPSMIFGLYMTNKI